MEETKQIAQDDRLNFNTGSMLLFITSVAIVLAGAFSLPPGAGAILLLASMLLWSGILLMFVLNGGTTLRAFFAGAFPPVAFVLYCTAWGIGWSIYNSSTSSTLSQYFAGHHVAIRAAMAGGWLLSTMFGTVCALISWRLQK